MMQKPWFKVFIWFTATAFFYLAAVIVISELGPAPDEQKNMLFMMGMMGAMHNSLMGFSMSLEGDASLAEIIRRVSELTVPIIVLSAAGALFVRVRRRNVGR